MVQTYLDGQWERVPLRGGGPIELILASEEGAALEIRGSAVEVRRLGHRQDDVVLPPGAIGEQPVTVVVTSLSGQAFGGSARVDISIQQRATGESVLLRDIPVAGKTHAVVLQLGAQGNDVVVRPAEGGSATRGLGGWCVRRLEEAGRQPGLAIRGIMVDSSRSMDLSAQRVEALTRFITDMAGALELPVPPVARVAVAGHGEAGVGAVSVPSGDAAGGVVLVTDQPVQDAGVAQLLTCDESVLQVLPAPRALALSAQAWEQMARVDDAFDERTLQALMPLLTWLAGPASSAPATGVVGGVA